jgi:hypothetical protein
MSQARRTLRVPDSVNRTLGDARNPLWYSGALQTENGRDVETVAPPANVKDGLLAEPLAVQPSGKDPQRRLSD